MEADRKASMVVLEQEKENNEETEGTQPEFPPGMAPKMLKLVKLIKTLESKIDPLISKPHHEVLSKLSSLEKAKVGLMEVSTINMLFWVLMRTSGENIDTTLRDDYKIEVGRLKEAQGRLSEIEARAHRQRLDVRAAERFVRHGLGISQRHQQEEEEEELQSSESMVNQSLQPIQFNSSNNDSGYQGQSESSGLSTPAKKKVKKKTGSPSAGKVLKKKNVIKKKKVDLASNKIVNKVVKKKKISKDAGQTLPEKKVKKKVPSVIGDTVADVNGQQKKGVGKKKRKIQEAGCEQGTEGETEDRGEDGSISTPSSKKKKKKPVQGKSVSKADIEAFLDTTRGRIDYQIEDDRDHSNKGRSWYEQGWT